MLYNLNIMKIQSFTFNSFQENTYILYDNSKECLIIDPGCYQEHEKETLISFIEENNLNPKKIINTHCHIDHVLGNNFCSKRWSLDIWANEKEVSILKNNKNVASLYGMNEYEESPNIKRFLFDQDVLEFGQTKLKVISAPGHSPGHICLYHSLTESLISGDVIFKQSIGRTDLPGGDFETLINSIKNKVLILHDNTKIFPGHGPSTKIGIEKNQNPFLQ